jgi:hypothetical protein
MVMEIIDLDMMMDYGYVTVKVALACSPIIAIVFMLACAHEDEDKEEAKRDQAKKAGSCKT